MTSWILFFNMPCLWCTSRPREQTRGLNLKVADALPVVVMHTEDILLHYFVVGLFHYLELNIYLKILYIMTIKPA
jgi:flagellar biosynthesis component FlhA